MRISTCYRFLNEQNGATLVEMAVVFPLFFFIVLGIMEFSVLMLNYINIQYAVRVAARYASIHSSTSASPASTSQVQAIVTSNLFLPSITSPTVIVYYGTGSGAGSNIVGDLVGVGVIWQNATIMGVKFVWPTAEAYRIITR